ncbi:MAG: DUF99 family protein [Candidatus Bathyarchaeia archaeon]
MNRKPLRVVKSEIRVLGIDDGKFTPHSKEQVLVVGVVFRGGYWLDGVMHTTVGVDAFDATSRITDMVTSSPHCKQLRVLILNGITLAGFNIVNIKALNEEMTLPVIAVTQKKPNLARVRQALNHLPLSEARWQAVLDAGEMYPVRVGRGKREVFMETAGISREVAERVLRVTSTRSNIPEALRVAHLVASGVSPF